MSKFFSLVSRILSSLATLIIRCNRNVSIGKSSLLFYRSSILTSRRGRVIIGVNSLIGRSKRGYHGGLPFYTGLLSDGDNSIISIGDNCRINGAYIHAKSQILIGDNCVFASGVSIVDSNGHETYSNNRTIGTDLPSPIIIGNNVWIGMNVIILKGSTIGDNSVISAGSVVKGGFPPNSLICGNPAKTMKILDIPRD